MKKKESLVQPEEDLLYISLAFSLSPVFLLSLSLSLFAFLSHKDLPFSFIFTHRLS